MVSILKHLPLALLSLVACGPGTNTTDSGSNTSTDTGTGTGTSDPTATEATAGTTDTPTTGEPTTVDPTGATGTTATTTATTTNDPTATTGGDDCSGAFPEDGDPCTSEGLICGGPCEDPCSFCNLSKCENGTWMQLEVFPANCLDCESVCNLVVPAACNAGPPDQENCVTGCMATQNGECGIVYNESLACIGDMPTFTCDEDGRPTVIGCADQFAALYECLG
jgi:hypothetical protein